MMNNVVRVVLIYLTIPLGVRALSAGDPQLAKSQLQLALASLSGKMTLSPEIVIPEPTDPTALLLQSTAVTKLSEKMRVKAKANSAWISGTINSLKTFCGEQENARGNFPGPLPVVYSPSSACSQEELKEVAEAGACGITVTVFMDEISSDDEFAATLKFALEEGLQPIPEVKIDEAQAATIDEAATEDLVESLTKILGSEPASLLLTINHVDDEEESEECPLPRVAKPLAKRLPILGSVTVPAGQNRIGYETERLKEAGFSGAILRSECVPGYRMNPDLEFVGNFWSACIGDLKSTRSKSFSFRAKNNMGKQLSTEWANLQQDIIESGSLGDKNDYHTEGLNEAAGDYMGF